LEDRFEILRREAAAAFGDDLVSLTLYGPGASGDPSGHPPTAVVVVREVRPGSLAAFRKSAPRLARAGVPVPPVFTEAFLASSADVFPLEFLAMKRNRRVLAGGDVAAGIAVDPVNLRHQVEFELKGKFLTLRRMYLEGGTAAELSSLLRSTVPSVLLAASGLLVLAEDEPPDDHGALVASLSSRFGIAFRVLPELASGAKISPSRAENAFLDYMEDVERLCDVADAGVSPR
jgi:hypothetical protein